MSNWSVAEKLSERVGCQKKIANNLIRLLTVEDNTPTFIGTDSKIEVVRSAHRPWLPVYENVFHQVQSVEETRHVTSIFIRISNVQSFSREPRKSPFSTSSDKFEIRMKMSGSLLRRLCMNKMSTLRMWNPRKPDIERMKRILCRLKTSSMHQKLSKIWMKFRRRLHLYAISWRKKKDYPPS